MDNEIADLDELIRGIYNNEDYQKIDKIAEEKVNAILTDKKAIISIAGQQAVL
jgi:hypothetical protein